MHPTILFPFWGKARGGEQWPGYADELIERGREFLELTELNEAELAVFPENWKQAERSPDGLDRARACAAEARSAGKPLVIFCEGDSADPIPVPEAIVFRTSLYASRREPREFAMPGFHEDLLAYVGGVQPLREWRRRPVVAFCGVALVDRPPGTALGRVRRAAGDRYRRLAGGARRSTPQDVFARAYAIEALTKQRLVDVNLMIRCEGGGGAMYPTLDRSLWPDVRREYVSNLVESDYALCARGIGNWSWRLYEALSVGRIPVFVDTDCVLPYDSVIDWREHCVWIDRSEIDRIGEKVAAFHESLTPEAFAELQVRCRRLWEEYLSPLGFFANLYRHFE